jgi:hypothetical protein
VINGTKGMIAIFTNGEKRLVEGIDHNNKGTTPTIAPIVGIRYRRRNWSDNSLSFHIISGPIRLEKGGIEVDLLGFIFCVGLISLYL